MSVVIHKQRLAYLPEQTLDADGDVAAILCIQMQGEVPCIWYEAVPNAGTSFQAQIVVRLVGTGAERPPPQFHYAGTTQAYAGAYIWHWYTRLEYPRP